MPFAFDLTTFPRVEEEVEEVSAHWAVSRLEGHVTQKDAQIVLNAEYAISKFVFFGGSSIVHVFPSKLPGIIWNYKDV